VPAVTPPPHRRIASNHPIRAANPCDPGDGSGSTLNQVVSHLESLRAYCSTLNPDGPIEDSTLQSRLEDAWPQIAGGEQGGMCASKLPGRLENLTWEPPCVTFTIERHGGTVLGSGRATLQDWTVDVDRGTAGFSENRHRRLRPPAAALDVSPLVDRVLKLILERSVDEWLTWNLDESVRVNIGLVIPDAGPKQTLQNRRRRFRTTLAHRLEEAGGSVDGLSYRPPARRDASDDEAAS
jgi:hypothetical protein